MPPLRAKRKRKTVVKPVFKDSSDELSESGTSGSSFNPSDSSEDSASSSEDSNSVPTNSSSKKKNTFRNDQRNKSTQKLKGTGRETSPMRLEDQKSKDNPFNIVKEGRKLIQDKNKVSSTATTSTVREEKTLRKPESSEEDSESDFFSSDDSSEVDYSIPKPKGTHAGQKIIELACQRLREGVETKAVAKEFGVPQSRVCYWRMKYIPPEERIERLSFKVSNKEVRECCNLYRQGVSAKVLARRYGISTDTVRDWRQKFAPETVLSYNRKYNDSIVLDVCKQLKKGESLKNIASKMNISVSTVRYLNYRYLMHLPEPKSKGSGEYSEYAQLEALDQLKQGVEPEIVAKDLKLDVNLVVKWKNERILTLKVEPVNQLKYDKNYVLNVCKRLQKGESGMKIARELGISSTLVYKWRDRYCINKKLEPKNGLKYSKDTILEACKLIRQGHSLKSVARKLQIARRIICTWRSKYLEKEEYERAIDYHTLGTASRLVKNVSKFKKRTILEACKLMKKGMTPKEVAVKLKVDLLSIQRWRRDYLVKSQIPKDDLDHDTRIKLRVCRRLNKGDLVDEVSKEFGVKKHNVYVWRRKYLPELCLRPLKRKKVTLKSEQKVVLTRREEGWKKGAFVPLRKVYIPKMMKLQFVKMIEDGACIKKLAKELNVNEVTIESWMLNWELLRSSKRSL